MTALALDKKWATLVVLVPAVLLLGLTTRTWASGESRDVLSRAVTEVSGGAAAPGVVGLCAVCVVALLGLMTGGRVIRAISAGVLVLAALGAALMTLFVALRPVTTVADAVARELARTTAPAATGTTTVWAWLAVATAGLLAVGAVLTAASSRSWAGLSGRYERGTKPASGPRGEVRTTWDELSEGHDPTLRDAPDET
ncbi:Trp biosynthesis-associated membrane protein [Terrabacter terrigena]|uniref:Trp biosynthesis-associated membrane protein n=1 Tax=Terrabacter terrigena TaxID=574718 RepID=A0ABW3MWA2_9MICO